MEVRAAQYADIPRLKELWLKSYPGDNDYADMYFSEYFSPDCAMAALDDSGIIRSVGYWFPTLLSVPGGSMRFLYLFAAATDPTVRRQGFLSAIVKAVFEKSLADGISGFVTESEPSTRGIIERMGGKACVFTDVCGTELNRALPRVRTEPLDAEQLLPMRGRYLERKPYAFAWAEPELRFMLRDLESDGGRAVAFDAGGTRRYALIVPSGNEVTVRETDCVRGEGEYLAAAARELFPDAQSVRAIGRTGDEPVFPGSPVEREYMCHVLPLRQSADMSALTDRDGTEPYMNLLAI